MHTGSLLASLVGVLPALSLRLDRQPPDLPGEGAEDLDGKQREKYSAMVRFGERDEAGSDSQQALLTLRELMPSSIEDWQGSMWPPGSAWANVSNGYCRADACDQPRVPLDAANAIRRPYVFIMGIEGSGHHALCPLLQRLLANLGYWVHRSDVNMFGRLEIMPFAKWKSGFLEELESWCPNGVCLNCFDSFPYERPMQPSSAPDFPRMVALHEQGHIDLRVISIVRNISDSVFSAIRRFPSDPVQAIAFSRQFLMEVVRNTDAWQRAHCERLATVRYEKLAKNDLGGLTTSILRALGVDAENPEQQNKAKAGIDAFSMHQKLKGFHAHEYREEDPELYDKVSSYFNEKESFLWPELADLWC